MKNKKSNTYMKILNTFLVVVFFTMLFLSLFPKTHSMEMDEKRTEFLELKMDIQNELIHQGDYQCCLEQPCTYCIEKTPGHGEGATCKCLEDIMNGVHPCGECIGEILEGHGNKYISKYFATAIAEEVGEEHLDTLKEIIAEKYDITVEEQI